VTDSERSCAKNQSKPAIAENKNAQSDDAKTTRQFRQIQETRKERAAVLLNIVIASLIVQQMWLFLTSALSARAQAETRLKIARSGPGQSLLCDLGGNVVHKLLSRNDFRDFVLNA